uniref:Uncharacterized protein n=1 Tax=Hyaloperonospora arabidopsidis (strain Emoy2) TaxID=559515 RepID=M4BU50_HYAAE
MANFTIAKQALASYLRTKMVSNRPAKRLVIARKILTIKRSPNVQIRRKCSPLQLYRSILYQSRLLEKSSCRASRMKYELVQQTLSGHVALSLRRSEVYRDSTG